MERQMANETKTSSVQLVKNDNDNKVSTNDNNDNTSIESLQKLSLKRIVDALVHQGYSVDRIVKILSTYNNSIYININTKDLKTKILDTFLDKLSSPSQENISLTDRISDYIQDVDGIFTFQEMCDMLGIRQDRNEKKKASVILGRFVKDGEIVREGKKNGVFRKVNKEIIEMDFMSASEEIEDIWLPFGMQKLVNIMPGNIIVFAGTPNSGKTAMLLNMVKDNQAKYKVHYFNSEMGSSELRKRLTNFDSCCLSDWKFRAIERSGDFEDAIVPGRGNLNIIDFLEMYDNFYEVSGKLAKIHDKLNGAIAVIAIQRNSKAPQGLGGERGLEKPRLYCNISPGLLEIVKGKNWATSQNPNGLKIKYKLQAGCNLYSEGDWHKAPLKEKKNGR